MKHMRNISGTLGIFVLAGSLLIGCSPSASQATSSASSEASQKSQTRPYTDYLGHAGNIPVSPARIIYSGETFGDMLALGVKPIGGFGYSNQIFEDQLHDVENVGFPINLEKVLELQPDLIINANTEEKEYEQLAKIAPTVIFDTFAPLEERMTQLGDILGKPEAARKWLADYKRKSEEMWKKLKESGTMKKGETASVFTYYPGDRLFVMARTGLSQVLYDTNGFKPTAPIQEILHAQKGFELISVERLPEIAGDRIFILNTPSEEAEKSTQNLLKSRIWKDLPAVKNGSVYFIDIEKSSSDATTREWLLQKIPEILAK
ncbi:ABC transporter substrate-binding protein [Brevibacillus brevis]|uniref:ABC transporter substrate-binding protein n=1 Tax=Brevibacillus brevis TaxID=1393 RepID=UPI001EDA2F78|nr:ABC transporter substrate-binding protein [Brevibacillus brevis]UKK99914.1 ABC transporter substrate-binding protein [Brevibacillus brevis]